MKTGPARKSKVQQRLVELLREFDESPEPFDTTSVGDTLRGFQPVEADISDDDRFVLMAESMAFLFHADYQDETTGWGTYYGPMIVVRGENGQWMESPSIKRVTPEMLDYWQARSEEVRNPILKSRYADLVWDLSKAVKGTYPDIQVAHTVISANLEIVGKNRCAHELTAIAALERSLSIALSIRDDRSVETICVAMLALEDRIAEDGMLGLWGFCFDNLVENKKVPLTEEQRRKILDDLENRLRRTSTTKETEPDPHAAEAAAIRLARYYRRTGQIGEAGRVLRLFGRAVVAAAESVVPLVGCAWIRKVYDTYYEYGLKEDADALTPHLEELGKRASEGMHTVSQEYSIPTEKLEEYLDRLTEGSLTDALTRIAWNFVPNTDTITAYVRKLGEIAPFQALMPFSVHDEDGRIVAQVGSLEEDLEGRVVWRMSLILQIQSVFLRETIERAREKFGISAEDLVEYLYLSPVFDPDRRSIISAGLEAYLNGDHLVATHLLIPQIEHTARRLMKMAGGAIFKPARRGGGLFLRNLEETLRAESVTRTLGTNPTNYFRVLLTDPRGMNLRNEVCHGTLSPGSLDSVVVDRLVHVLLFLAQGRTQSAALGKRASESGA